MAAKICFVTDAHQEKYAVKFNKKIQKFAPELNESFQYYVCSDRTDLIEDFDFVKKFELSKLQDRHPETKEYEAISDTVKYREYPWNLRRHIIYKALEDGFDYVIWNDCDVTLCDSQEALKLELDEYKPNNIYTEQTIWNYGKQPERIEFSGFRKAVADLGLVTNESELSTHDGPSAIYVLDHEHRKRFIENWDRVTLYGYQENYYGQPNWFIPNLVYALGLSDIKVLSAKRKLFRVDHVDADRYH